MISLGVAMIVKNEEEMLPDCLQSIVGIDELVICDTGSTDKTVSLANDFTNKVYTDYVWQDDFGEARNHALSKSTADWILTIDADEWLDQTIDQVKEEIGKHPGLISLGVSVHSSSGKTHHQPRLFKRCEQNYFIGKIHEYLSTPAQAVSAISLTYEYSPTHQTDPDRAMRILTQVVADDPKAIREKFYLAREYIYRRDYPNCIMWALEYLKEGTWLAERAEAYFLLANCYWQTQQGEKARDNCLQAIKINANMKKAHLLMAEMSWESNAKAWRKFAGIADDTNTLFT